MAAEIISKEMSSVSHWLRHNHLTLNYNKTVSMCFSLKRKINENRRVRFDCREIEEVNELNLLGVTLVSQLKFDGHIKRLCKTVKTKLSKQLNSLCIV